MASLASITVTTTMISLLLFSVATSTRILTELEETAAPIVSPVSNEEFPPHPQPEPEPLSFFMHDVVGGSNPTARAVTGVVTNPALNAQVAFAKPNGANIPLNNGVPQNNNNAGFLNNNNLPFLTGLSGNPGNSLINYAINCNTPPNIWMYLKK